MDCSELIDLQVLAGTCAVETNRGRASTRACMESKGIRNISHGKVPFAEGL